MRLAALLLLVPACTAFADYRAELDYFEYVDVDLHPLQSRSLLESQGGEQQPDRVSLSFEFRGTPFHAELSKTSLVSKNYKEIHMHPDGRWHHAHEDSFDGRPSGMAGPRSRDCFYKGKLLNSTGSQMLAATCGDSMHAVVHSDKFGVLELRFIRAENKHIVYRHADHPSKKKTSSCGVKHHDHSHDHDDHDHDHDDHDHDHPSSEGVRRLLAANECASRPTKTVEVLVLNDQSQHDFRGEDTENYAAQVMQHVATKYDELTGGTFACEVEVTVIGQLTFRYGNPASIVQRACNTKQQMPYPAASAACCSARTSRGKLDNCATGDNYCLDVSPCPFNSAAGIPVGCGTIQNGGWGSINQVKIHRFSFVYQGCVAGGGDDPNEIDESDFLNSVGTWANSNRQPLEAIFGGGFDNTVMISGLDFSQSTVGLGTLSGMCTGDGSANINMGGPGYDSPLSTAITVAHEMGHNFGMEHSTNNGNIMSASSNGAVSPSVVTWVGSSRQDINNFMTAEYSGADGCMEPGSTTARDPSAQRCGDGVVQGDEQCDPGFGKTDSCCKGCKLKAGCECANLDPCCSNGSFKSKGTVCRGSEDADCDLVERCSGTSSRCPLDSFKAAGEACASGSGLCYEGACVLNDASCSSYLPDRCVDLNAPCQIRCGLARSDYSCNGFQGSSASVSPGTKCGAGKQCVAQASSEGGEAGLQCVDSSTLRAYNWKISDWSSCVASTVTRTVECTDEIGAVVVDNLCQDAKPDLTDTCSIKPVTTPPASGEGGNNEKDTTTAGKGGNNEKDTTTAGNGGNNEKDTTTAGTDSLTGNGGNNEKDTTTAGTDSSTEEATSMACNTLTPFLLLPTLLVLV